MVWIVVNNINHLNVNMPQHITRIVLTWHKATNKTSVSIHHLTRPTNVLNKLTCLFYLCQYQRASVIQHVLCSPGAIMLCGVFRLW